MEVAVLKYSGEKTAKKVTLSDEVFGIEPNDHAIYLDVDVVLAFLKCPSRAFGVFFSFFSPKAS